MKRKRFARLIACALLLCLIPGILAFPVSAKYFEDVYPGMLAREFFDAIKYRRTRLRLFLCSGRMQPYRYY